MSVAVVVAGDANIFALTYGCLLSLLRIQNKDVSIYFLDTGCTAAQLAAIEPLVKGIAQFDIKRAIEPAGNKRPYWKAQGCRPFLPLYFQGHDVYVWLDSDTWVQDVNAIVEMAQVADAHGAAIAPEVSASYTFLNQAEASRKLYLQKFEFVRGAYGEQIANAMLFMPYLNTGVFAISKKSGLFEALEAELRIVYARGYNHMAEQICLNKILIESGKYQPLSAAYNWMCNYSQPVRNAAGDLTAPNAPFDPVKIVHLCGKNKIAVYLPLGLLFDRGAYLSRISQSITPNDGYFV